MNIFPLLKREICVQTRSPRYRKTRLQTAATAVATFSILMFLDRGAGGFNLRGLPAIAPVGGMLPFMLLIIGLTRGSLLLDEERNAGTLPLLLLTRVTGRDIALGKILQAMLFEASFSLLLLPVALLPMIALGFSPAELCLLALAAFNILFFAMTLGLFGSLFGQGRVMASWWLLLIFPLVAYSTPLGLLLPGGKIKQFILMFHWLNPCEAFNVATQAAAGIQRASYWSSLLSTHAVGWGVIWVTGRCLSRMTRWRLGLDCGIRSARSWWARDRNRRSAAFRTRLLNVNPFHWLTSRSSRPTAVLWFWLAVIGLGWGALALFSAGRGINIGIVFAIAVGFGWLAIMLGMPPNEAGRRLVEDRHNGGLEMLLCTPLTAGEIARGQWLSLRRRYLPPLLLVTAVSLFLAIAGYATFGFGGMLDAEQRNVWLAAWLSGIALLLVGAITLSWLIMRQTLLARRVDEAMLVVWGKALAAPLAIGLALSLQNLLTAESLAVLSAVSVVVLSWQAWRARRIFLSDLRRAAAEPYSG